MADKTSRTEELPDGNVGAWYTDENDVEQYLGAFKDERHATFEIGNALETAEARRNAREAEAAPKTAKAEPATKK